MLNTPPTYAIYIAGLVFEWTQGAGRPGGDRASRNIAKAALLYDYLDRAPSTATRCARRIARG